MTIQNRQEWTDKQSIFLDWLASPKSLREPKTQIELADKLGVNRTTLTNWQNLDGFKEERLKRTIAYFITDTPDIVAALRDKALTGDSKSIEIWLEKIEKIASQLELKGDFTLKGFYESILNGKYTNGFDKRPSVAGEAELPVTPEADGSNGESSKIQDTSSGEKVRQEPIGSIPSNQDDAVARKEDLDSSTHE